LLPKLSYHRASTIDEAVGLLSEYGKKAKILAGGTDLLIGLEAGAIAADKVIDIKCIHDLREISVSRSGELTIGACVTVNEILEAGPLPAGMDAVLEAASLLATYQIRNRATVGGNVCNASPACDLGPPLLVLGANLRIMSADGERIVPLTDFFSGVKMTCCEPDELVTHIMIPPVDGTVTAFRKRQRIDGHDLALVNAAAALSGEGKVRIALGAVAMTPLLIDDFGGAGPDDPDEVVKIIKESASPIDDVRSSRIYREHMVEYLVRELLDVLRRR
jgi:carbon-monoxide dehydrogenase medium subunit